MNAVASRLEFARYTPPLRPEFSSHAPTSSPDSYPSAMQPNSKLAEGKSCLHFTSFSAGYSRTHHAEGIHDFLRRPGLAIQSQPCSSSRGSATPASPFPPQPTAPPRRAQFHPCPRVPCPLQTEV